MSRFLLRGVESLLAFLLIFPPLAHGAVETWSVTIVHLAAICALALWLASAAGDGRLRIRRTPLDLPIVLFLGAACLAASFSVHPYASRIQLYRLLTYAIVFFVLIQTVASRRQLLRLTWCVVLFGGAYAAAALSSAWGSILGFETFSREARGLSLTFVNRNHFAGYLEMVTGLSLGLALARRGTVRALLLWLSVLAALAVLFSLSRGGLLALAAGLTFLLATLAWDRRHHQNLPWAAGFLALLLLAAAGLGLGPVLENIDSLKDPLSTGATRIEIWQSTLEMIADRPWTGSGPGTYADAYPRYQRQPTAHWRIHHAHNDYLEMATELGIPGLLTALLGLGVLLTRGLRDLAAQSDNVSRLLGLGALSGCVAVLIHSTVEFNSHIPSNALLFSFVTAVTILAGRIGRRRESAVWIDLCLGERSKRLLYAGALALCGLGLAGVAPPYLASRHAQQAREARLDGRHDLSASKLEHAIKLDPGDARHHLELADLLAERSRTVTGPAIRRALLDRALGCYEQATRALPVKGAIFGRKAWALERLGRDREAEEAFRRAIQLAPVKASTHYHFARFLRRRGSREESLSEYRRFLEIADDQYMTVFHELRDTAHSDTALAMATPRTAHARNQLARYLQDQGDTRAAAQQLALAFSLEPTLANALSHLRGLIAGEEYRAALEAADEYLRRFGWQQSLCRLVADTHTHLGQSSQAVALYERVLDQDPTAIDSYLGLGELHRRAGRPVQAIDAFDRGIAHRPRSAHLHAGLARAYAAMDLPEKELPAAKRAVWLQPRQAPYRDLLGRTYHRLGMFQPAIAAWQECLEIEPGHPGCRHAIERIREQLGIDTADRGPR